MGGVFKASSAAGASPSHDICIDLSTAQDTSTTLEAIRDFKTQVNVACYQLDTLHTNSTRKISALIESHAHDVKVVHASYSEMVIEYEDREAELLLLCA